MGAKQGRTTVMILLVIGAMAVTPTLPPASASQSAPKTPKSAEGSKPTPVPGRVKIISVSEEPRLITIAHSSVAASRDSRFVFVALQFEPSSDAVASSDFLLVGTADQEFRCAGLGDGRGAGRYCLDPNLKFTRRVWQDEQYFDGGCAEHNGRQLAYDTFTTNKPVAAFVVPTIVPIRNLALKYKGGASLPLVSSE